MYEFVCDHIIPGCTHKETAETEEAVRELAIKHLHEHDDMGYIDDDVSMKLQGAITFLAR